MTFFEYLKLRKARSVLKSAIKMASTVRHMQCDVAGEVNDKALLDVITSARTVCREAKSVDVLNGMVTTLLTATGKGTAWRPLHKNAFAENFEVFAVAIGVAMAFRCYLFEPFKIPTGSMQPTLYGIYSTDQAEPGIMDRMPLKVVKWLVTGDWYKDVRVTAGGTIYPVMSTVKPGYTTFQVGGRPYHIPSDAVSERPQPFVKKLQIGQPLASGERLWSGVVHAGDHVFVNRIVWNFRKPRRGEVMVFSTTGVTGLPPYTHYIKRMVGLPNETISIRPPQLVVNGEPVSEPYTIGRIVRKEAAPRHEGNYSNYLGYSLIGNIPANHAPAKHPLRFESDSVALASDEYLGFGDNTGNSYDGRYWGTVPAKNLLGPGAVVYWPFTSKRFGIIH